jgi:hypothetical protein
MLQQALMTNGPGRCNQNSRQELLGSFFLSEGHTFSDWTVTASLYGVLWLHCLGMTYSVSRMFLIPSILIPRLLVLNTGK